MQPSIIIICCMSRVVIICEFCIHVEEQRVKNDQLQAFNMLNIRVSGIKIPGTRNYCKNYISTPFLLETKEVRRPKNLPRLIRIWWVGAKKRASPLLAQCPQHCLCRPCLPFFSKQAITYKNRVSYPVSASDSVAEQVVGTRTPDRAGL